MPLSKDGRGWWLFHTCELPLAEHVARVDGVELFYRMGGSGPPLLLLHGRSRAGLFWVPFLDAFGERYTVIVPDLPGHGRSSDFPEGFTHRDTARLLFALLDQLGLGRARGIGHSSGAFVLIHMATQRPERMEAMVLVNGAHRQPLKTREWVRTICWENQDEETHELLLRHHPGGELQIRAMLAQWRLQAEDHGDFDLSPEHLATISAKTLLVWGDRDDLFPVELALEMYRAIPNSALWVAPGQGHDPFPEILPAFPAKVMAFFGENWPA